MTSDGEIIRRIRQGDKREFEALFRSFYISLVRYAKSIVKDHDSAEEIVQDLFFRLWKDKEKIRIESSLSGYLFRSVHNKCLQRVQHDRVVEKHARDMSVAEPGYMETPDDIITFEELRLKIALVLDRLPGKCSQVFCMNRFEGLRYREIAEKLSISIKTVEANMGRALKEFRKALGK
jgi:RNA polymerase sigma-70 factor (ECF subfamily)